MFTIGDWSIPHATILAPMAGVTDEPFRQLCLELGAGMAVSEMVTSDERLWKSRKSQQRLSSLKNRSNNKKLSPTTLQAQPDFTQVRSVQLAGNDPLMMANAAKANAAMGADIIDINMGCPAKKVCKKAAGSALLRDEKLVAEILHAVVNAVDIPVTLKIRTGWSQDERNGVQIARIAEDSGIQALAVHGRTRACAFKGDAEYDTIAEIVNRAAIPVFANGDITSPEKAKNILEYTRAKAVMIGRAAQGNPWIFREINHYLATGERLDKPSSVEIYQTLSGHIHALHRFYGELMGVRIARKHVGWYLKYHAQHAESDRSAQHYEQFRQVFNALTIANEQLDAIEHFFTGTVTSTDIYSEKQSVKKQTIMTNKTTGEIAA
ncbi:tRNA dihydrouridine synthase DusB [Eionea flava]